MKPVPHKTSIRPTPVTLLIGFMGFIIVPVLVTGMIPASWVTLNRSADGRVSATTRTCVLFAIPWRTQHSAEVTGIDARSVRSDRTGRQRYRGADRGSFHSDGEAELIIQGQPRGLTVNVSPASVDEAKRKAQAFLQDEKQHRMRFFVIANWKFGLGFGIPLTLLAVLYTAGSLPAILRFLFRAMRA